MDNILQTSHPAKTIKGRDLVTDVNIHVRKGEIYGFLGPNGAGKTTVMRMLTNLWRPTGGVIELFGEKMEPGSYQMLGRMGSIIEFPAFYENLTGRKNLWLHCEYMGYYHHGSIEEALEMLQLAEAADQPVKNYSLGMKQRLGIARAILCRPELLILDEPTNGLDPAGLKQNRELFRTLSREYEMTIFLSSHLLSEVEDIADTIGIIHQGKTLREISMKDITKMNTAYIELSVDNVRQASRILSDQLSLDRFKVTDGSEIRIYTENIETSEISRALAQSGVGLHAISRKTETLEDYYLSVTEGAERL